MKVLAQFWEDTKGGTKLAGQFVVSSGLVRIVRWLLKMLPQRWQEEFGTRDEDVTLALNTLQQFVVECRKNKAFPAQRIRIGRGFVELKRKGRQDKSQLGFISVDRIVWGVLLGLGGAVAGVVAAFVVLVVGLISGYLEFGYLLLVLVPPAIGIVAMAVAYFEVQKLDPAPKPHAALAQTP